MGKVPLDQLAKEKGIEVEWKAFELKPEGEETPPKSPEYMERARKGVEQLAAQYGLDMKFNASTEHSRHALEGAKYAEIHGKGNEYHDAVFAAQFQQERDINNLDVLVEIAGNLGLDQDEFRQVLEERTYQEAVLLDHAEAVRLGVTGIPCFVSGNQGVMGAQTYESLKQLVEGE
ncbi:MAG TPA: DsbA family protein [Bacillales bacterium]|nr:DsbA family protein [Bacillales bacterium]